MITFNALSRTFHLRHQGQVATGFVIDVDAKQYLVTAKHFVPNAVDSVALDLLHNGMLNCDSALVNFHSVNCGI